MAEQQTTPVKRWGSQRSAPVIVAQRAAGGKDKRSQAGIAVLLVVVCLAIIAPFTATFNYQARVDWQSAANVRDEVAAKQVQRGAMQLSLLLFEIQRQVFNQKQFRDFAGSLDITMVAPYLMSVFGTQDGAEGLGALVGLNTEALSDLALQEGTFEFRVYPESGKININCVSVQNDGEDNPAGRTIQTLEALMRPTIYNPLFEEVKSTGRSYTRTRVTRTIADYIDDDRQLFDVIRLRSTAGDESREYEYTQLNDPYTMRNGRLDSIEELHLVEGIDDDWMEAFSHELTVYGQCKVNLNFASADQIALVLRHAATEEDKFKTEGDDFLLRTVPLANFIVQYREFNLFEDFQQFADLAANPEQYMGAGFGGFMNQDIDADDVLGAVPQVPDGIELNVNAVKPGGEVENEDGEKEVVEDGRSGLDEIATVAPERVYTVEIITRVGDVNKRLTAVYDMQYARSQSQGKGAWLYIRED